MGWRGDSCWRHQQQQQQQKQQQQHQRHRLQHKPQWLQLPWTVAACVVSLLLLVLAAAAAVTVSRGTSSSSLRHGTVLRVRRSVALLVPMPGCARPSSEPFVWASNISRTQQPPQTPSPAASVFAALLQLAAAHDAAAAAQGDHDSNGRSPGGAPLTLQLPALLAAAGRQLPAGGGSGRGIVIVAGGAKYTPSAFVAAALLRRVGCMLPIQIWAPPHEPVAWGAAQELAALGNVWVGSLGDAFPGAAAAAVLRANKYLAKPAALLASSFLEILALDADNLALRDPTFLLDEPAFTGGGGLVMWPDFWPSEVAPEGFAALGIPAGSLRPAGSFESGQVLLHKGRAWKPLLLAMYLNLRGELFYPLLSRNGQGDKETLPLAWRVLQAAGVPLSGNYTLVPYGVLAVGGPQPPDGRFEGLAMAQRWADSLPLFLHAHNPKVSVPWEPIKLPLHTRRWQRVQPEELTVVPLGMPPDAANTYHLLNAVAGFDVESEVQRLRAHMRCRPAWVQCCLSN